MSQENVEVVRDARELWNRDDLEGMLRCYTPHFEFDVTRYPD